MNTRALGKKSGLKAGQVSMGCMRFPSDANDAVALIRYGIDAGLRYLDSSRGYADSEWQIGRALRDGYREKAILSTKCSPWNLQVRSDDAPTADSTYRRIKEQMTRLDVDRLDFYQVWNVDTREHWEQAVAKGGMVEGIKRARKDGLVDHIGMTVHDTPQNVLGFLDNSDWCEAILVSFNILDRTYAPVLKKAHDLGMATMVMNPVGGGRFADDSKIFAPIAAETGSESLADLAIRYVTSHPYIDTMLSGVTCEDEINRTVKSASKPLFTPTQMKRIEGFTNGLFRETVKFCTACSYCMPCPQGIRIPRAMTAIYEKRFLGLEKSAARTWKHLGGTNPAKCTRCGLCLKKCTQKLNIPDLLAWGVANIGGA